MTTVLNVINKCRGCDSSNIFIGLSFGKIPIVTSYLNSENDNSDLFELDLAICKDCGLGQVIQEFPREKIFTHYTFKSSVTKMNNDFAKEYVSQIINEFTFDKNDWVLEIGSNDGYLLKYFKEKNIDVLGVDPAKNISAYAICQGIPVINDFFGSEIAKEILKLKGFPKLIVANHVLAHGPYLQDFMQGISMLCNDETIVTIENPTIMNILKHSHFDTIYHEHFSYLSAHSVDLLCKKFDLSLFNIEKIPTHGGSNRYWLSKNKTINKIVEDTIEYEVDNGLLEEKTWELYSKNLNDQLFNFYKKIQDLNNSGSKIYGYTASGKAVILLSLSNIEYGWISGVADDAIEKQNKLLPLLNIPIINLSDMLKENPTDIIVFAWNIYDEIVAKLRSLGYNGNILKWNDK